MRGCRNLLHRLQSAGRHLSTSEAGIEPTTMTASIASRVNASFASAFSEAHFQGSSFTQTSCHVRSHRDSAFQAGPSAFHLARSYLEDRGWHTSNRRFSNAVQQHGGIECICSAHFHQGGPLPSSHMLAPRTRLENDHLTQERSLKQTKVCRAARLRTLTQIAMVSLQRTMLIKEKNCVFALLSCTPCIAQQSK
jgi:hypothetical protein